jgi:hypothetical protein
MKRDTEEKKWLQYLYAERVLKGRMAEVENGGARSWSHQEEPNPKAQKGPEIIPPHLDHPSLDSYERES